MQVLCRCKLGANDARCPCARDHLLPQFTARRYEQLTTLPVPRPVPLAGSIWCRGPPSPPHDLVGRPHSVNNHERIQLDLIKLAPGKGRVKAAGQPKFATNNASRACSGRPFRPGALPWPGCWWVNTCARKGLLRCRRPLAWHGWSVSGQSCPPR